MIRIALILLFFLTPISAEFPPIKTYQNINECQSDIYYGNGIMTTYDEAKKALINTLKPAILHEIYDGNATRMNRMHHFDVAYNYSFKKKFGDTMPAMLLDLVEAYGQLTDTSSAWWIVDKTKSALTDLALGPVDIVGKYGVKKISKVFMKYGLDKWIAEWLAEQVVDTDRELIRKMIADLTGTSVEAHHDHDLTRMVAQYKESIKAGHGVIIVSHSQGNLFAIEAVEKLDGWMKEYIYQISIASPATKFAAKKHWLISLDNDAVAKTPGSVGTNTRNYARYFTYDIALDVPDGYENSTCAEQATLDVHNNVADGFWVDGRKPDTLTRQSECGGVVITVTATPDESEWFQIKFHAFDFYMGKSVYPLHKSADQLWTPPQDTLTKEYKSKAHEKIVEGIAGAIKAHHDNESQYEIVKRFGCMCGEKYVRMKHIKDADLTKKIQQYKIKDFAENLPGKIYPVYWDGHFQYVHAQCGGEIIETVEEGEVCLRLKDEKQSTIGEISGPRNNPTTPDGLFRAYLGWSETQVHMELSNSLMKERVSGCGMAAAGSGDLTLHDVYPGTYAINTVNVEGYASLEGNLSDEVTLLVKAVTASSQDRFTVTDRYQYPNLGVGGHIADIVISRPKPTESTMTVVIPTQTRYGGSSGSSGGSVVYHTYTTGASAPVTPVVHRNPPLCQPAKSCGCLPCQYAIKMYLSQAELGPIGGADVKLYKATDADEAQRALLYEGRTTLSTNLNDAGIIQLPIPYPQQPKESYTQAQRDLLEAIEGYEGDFILEISGGVDIDSDDDLVVDNRFKEVHGKLHLILSKERLMQNDYRVNILTEIGYQLSRDLLGTHYDKHRVQARLDDIAKHILIEKLYPDANAPIGRDDLMWWIPSAHKNWLLKPYAATLAPIVEKVYAGEEIYDDAYGYVYDSAHSDTVPLLKSQWLKVDENATGGAYIGMVVPLSEGNSSIEAYLLQGDGVSTFTIDSEGRVYLEANATLDYETTPLYQLQLRARNEAGESRPVTLYIALNNLQDAPEERSFEGGVVSEDAVEGDVAGRIIFDEGGAAIDMMEVTGADAQSFVVEHNGTIRVSANADLDYERAPAAHIIVRAHNAYGYSRAVSVTIVVADAVDIPIVGMADVKIEENMRVGSIVAQVDIESNDPITDVILQGEGASYFTIDMNGTVRVAQGARLDYEQRANYVLQVRASNSQGTSRAGTLIVRLQNVPDVPELQDMVFHIAQEAPAESYVGTIGVEENGTSPIEAYLLTGEESHHFRVDAAGRLFTRDAMPRYEEKALYTFDVQAQNAQGVSLKSRISVYIDTDRPVIGVLDTWVYENAEAGTTLGKIPVLRSASAIERFELSGEGSENFTVDSNGTLCVAKGAQLDYERMQTYTLLVTPYSREGAGESRPIYVRVVDRDDTLEIRGFSATIHEDIAPGSVIGYLSIVKNGGKKVSYFELKGKGSEHFAVDKGGLLTIVQADFDDQREKSYRLEVTAMAEDGTSSNRVWIDLYIDDALKGHPLLAATTLAVEENATVGSTIGTLRVIENGRSAIERFTLEGDDHFGIDDKGHIVLQKPLDYEQRSRYTLQGVAYNHTTSSEPTSVYIDVINIPDTPPTLKPMQFEIAENLPIGSVVGSVEVLDRGEGNITGYRLTDNGHSLFAVDCNGTIRTQGAIDYEQQQHYRLQAVAQSTTGESIPADIVVSVLNVPEFVPQISDASIVSSGVLDKGSLLGRVSIVDSGDTPVNDTNLSGEGSALFVLAVDGSLHAKEPMALPSGETKVYTMQYRMKNQAGWSKSHRLKVVLDSSAPTLTLLGKQRLYVAQGTPYKEPGYDAYDEIDGDITARVQVENPVSTDAPVGTTFTVVYRVHDSAGNEAEVQERSVVIVRNLNIDLSAWQEDGEGEWTLQDQEKSVLQTINTPTPAVFHNGLDSQSPLFKLQGKIKVLSGNDDDFIGFVLGYHQGDLQKEQVDYLVIDWKRRYQSGQRAGLAISRVTGKLSEDSSIAWSHNASQGFTELQRGKSLGNTGWQYNQEYAFEITFTATKVEVWIDGNKEIDLDGNFSDGAYGFYNFSQDHVVYSAVEAAEE